MLLSTWQELSSYIRKLSENLANLRKGVRNARTKPYILCHVCRQRLDNFHRHGVPSFMIPFIATTLCRLVACIAAGAAKDLDPLVYSQDPFSGPRR